MQKIWLSLLLVSVATASLWGAETMTLEGTLRDFYDYSKENSKNPDFENPNYPPPSGYGHYAVTGLVQSYLDHDRKPVLQSAIGQMGDKQHRSITDADSFAQWYRDVPGINESMPYTIVLTKNGNVYEYENHVFFPLDGQLIGNECERGKKKKFATCKNTRAGYWGNDHNYHFTYEIHSKFTYQGGETFTFSGDDDVWVFIDNRLAVDIGGIHSSVTKSVDLDTLGLTQGQTYAFDFFFAERHITGSNFKITTNIAFEESIDKPFTCNSESFVSFNTASYAGDGVAQFDTISLIDGTLKSHDVLPEVEGVNTMGYNVKDNHLWGYNIGSNKLVRIDADHHARLYDLPTGFPGDFYIAGDVDQQGVLHLAARGEHQIQRVNVDPDSPDFLKALPPLKLKRPDGSAATIATADFAFNPKDGKLYFIQEDTDGKIYRIDPQTGVMEYVLDSGVDPYVVICFFDKDGNYYFNLGTGDNTRALYKIDMNDPKPATKFSDLDKGLRNGDGARCPNASVDSTPRISITGVQRVVEGDSGTKEVRFTVTSDSEITDPDGVAIEYSLRDGTAKAGSDYVAQSGTLVLKSRSQEFTLPLIIGDRTVEQDEDFYLELVPKTGISLAKGTAKVVIVDDDQAAFDAYDPDGGVSGTHAIKTKIVAAPFTLELASLQDATHYADGTDALTDTKVKIVESSACTSDPAHLDMHGFTPFSLGGHSHVNHTFTLNHAMEQAKVQFYWKDATAQPHAACSSDAFAVRPKAYRVSLPNDLVAGRDFNLTVTAVDADGATVENYQAHADAYRLDINESKAAQGCSMHVISVQKRDFSHGRALVTVHYTDVGKLLFDVAEVPGMEYARIDSSDGSASHRFIEPVAVTGSEIKPFNIVLDWQLSAGDALNGYTYFNSYDPTDADRAGMKAALDMTIKTLTAEGGIARNFTDGCYARDIDLDLVYDINSSDTDPHYLVKSALQDGNGTFITGLSGLPATMDRGSHYLAMKLEKGLFSDGIGMKKINFNFARETDKPREPMRLSVHGIKATLDGLQDIEATPKNLIFLYVRAHIQDQQFVGKEGDAKVFYEVWCERCDRVAFGLDTSPESVDTIRWYRLPTLSETTWLDFEDPAVTNHLSASPSTVSAVSGTFESMQRSTDHRFLKMRVRKTPTRAKVDYKPAPYLIFDPSDAAATTGSFIADFVPDNTKWGGRGKVGFTVDTRIDPRTRTDKLDW